jgi:hypothetical protein
MRRVQWIRQSICLVLPMVLVMAVRHLYEVAPCSTFSGWYPPTLFFGYVWPALVPAVLLFGVFNILFGGRILGWKWVWCVWALLIAIVIYGWITGYLMTYLWSRSTPFMPWPQFC